MKPFDVSKYLKKNPAPRITTAEKIRIAVVIPAYDENENIQTVLTSVQRAAEIAGVKILTILVINYPAGSDPAQSVELLSRCRSGALPADQVIYLPELSGGVGAARKAGMDAFIHTIPPEEMEKSVIYSLDADTLAGENYFKDTLDEIFKGGAVSIPFSHQKADDPDAQKAIARYEAYMTRYVQKLSEAGSPYAFYTIGSAFAVRCDAYIRAGGMKIRQAGEDFYFLQAVAKSSAVRQLTGEALVFPSPRISARVPFGTGPAVASLLAGNKLNEIPDHAFEELKILLDLSRQDQWVKNAAANREILSPGARDFLKKEGFFNIWEKVCKNLPDSAEKRQKAFNEWFDGLKTLKFLHFFSDLNNFDIDKKLFKC